MRKFALLLFWFLCLTICNAQNYNIAPLERNLVNGSGWISPDAKSYGGMIWDIERTQSKQVEVSPKKEKSKRKNSEKQVALPVNYSYEAKLTNEKYDPNEVLTNGFSLSLWVAPFASPAPGHGFVLFPLQGRNQNGINQSQWGITVGKDYVRVYERYLENALILEYKHSEKADFFITLTCQNRTPALYINGVLVSTGTPSSYSPHPALEGTQSCPVSMKFIGKSTQIHYFPRVLTNNEIRGLYQTEYNALHKTK